MRISDWSSDVCSSYLVQSASDDLQTLHAYWRAGDAEAIWDEMGADMRDRYPKLYRHINVERNDAWVPKIEQMLAEPGTDTPWSSSVRCTCSATTAWWRSCARRATRWSGSARPVRTGKRPGDRSEEHT